MLAGGAGGKGTWGKLGDELGVDSTTTDEKDPNYDSDGQASSLFRLHSNFTQPQASWDFLFLLLFTLYNFQL